MTHTDIARTWVACLEEYEARCCGVSREAARALIARRTGVPEGRLYSLSRGRLKAIAADHFERIRTAYYASCERQIEALQHELRMRRSDDSDADLAAEAEALLQKLRKARGK